MMRLFLVEKSGGGASTRPRIIQIQRHGELHQCRQAPAQVYRKNAIERLCIRGTERTRPTKNSALSRRISNPAFYR